MTTASAIAASMTSFGVVKHGLTDRDWEDAASHSDAAGRFAIADGAASAYQAAAWSHLLASSFVSTPVELGHDEAFDAWRQELASQWDRQTAVGDDAAYYLRHAQARGSASTFLGVTIGNGSRFSVVGVGDSCLFVIRGERIVGAFPLTTPEEFGFHPELVSTKQLEPVAIRRAGGDLSPGDTLLGCTDAAAEWLLAAHRDGRQEPLRGLLSAVTDIDELVAEARADGSLRNDDVAVVRCRIESVR